LKNNKKLEIQFTLYITDYIEYYKKCKQTYLTINGDIIPEDDLLTIMNMTDKLKTEYEIQLLIDNNLSIINYFEE
jgi:hypothetical protein